MTQQHEAPIPIHIPAPLHRRIEEALPRAGHPSVEAFVVSALRVALAACETTAEPEADEAKIVERLRRLGYLD